MTGTRALDPARVRSFVSAMWKDACTPSLVEFVRIPNKSPSFDPLWREHGHMDRAAEFVAAWCAAHAPQGLPPERAWTVSIERLPGRTPLVCIVCPAPDGREDDPVLLYGHLDKQPEMTGWSEGLGPWTPVLRDGRLYGRGGADDGYAAFACVTALRALHDQGALRRRAVVLIEACEESGSYDLPAYVEHLAPRIGSPSLVVCMDSGCGNYDQWWVTTSLRGIVVSTLSVEVLTEGVHSGDGGGVVADSFRILRGLLDRVEDVATGKVRLPECHAEIPAERIEQARRTAAVLGRLPLTKYPLVAGMRCVTDDPAEAILDRTWRPALTVTGADGLPPVKDAGNVHRPGTSVKLSLRLPPTCDADRAGAALRDVLAREAPYGARVRVSPGHDATGWNAPAESPWLRQSLSAASSTYFGRDVMYMGEGGTIPFMAMLGAKFPAAQFCVTGALGPGSNAHGPNEFLDLATAERVTMCVTQLLADHASRSA